MPLSEQENTKFWVKAGLYILGTMLGIAAKLATISRTEKITTKTALIETAIATAAAYFVWSLLHYKFKEDDIAIIASVLVGRFGDKILLSAFAKVEDWLAKKSDEKP